MLNSVSKNSAAFLTSFVKAGSALTEGIFNNSISSDKNVSLSIYNLLVKLSCIYLDVDKADKRGTTDFANL